MVRVSLVWFVLFTAYILAGRQVFCADAEEEGDGAGEAPSDENDADVQVEEEKEDDDKKATTKETADGDKKSTNETEEELPKTIRIGDKDIPIERADRTQTAEVTFEMSLGNEVVGNITLGLFGKACPKTVRNFVTLANPNRKTGEGYKGSKIHRIVKGFAIQGGDYLHNDGSGGWSIYGRYFRDENFSIGHFPFCLSMANSGPNTNASQFFIPVIRTKWLDGRHVVFGQVNNGHKVVKAINDIKTNRFSRPMRQVWISNTWTKVLKVDSQKKSEL